MARRHGSEAVRRRSNGRWEGQLRLADGTRKYVYARNRRELITRLQEERWRLACGLPVKARGLTLAGYSTQWLEVMRGRLRPTTYAGYELCLRRAVSRLGAVPIARLTPQLIQACYAGLLAEGLSPRTVFHTHAVLHRALKQARNWGLTTAIPTELVSVPRLPYREMRALPGRVAATPMWLPNLGGLAVRRPTFTVDLLGDAGLSVQSRPLTDGADQARWLADVLRALGLHRVHLLGVSFGGWTAFNLALHAPERVASVSLLDPANIFGRYTWKVVVVSLGSVVPALPESWRRRLLSWISGGADVSGGEPIADLISAGMRDFASSLPQPTYPTDDQLSSVELPVLAIIAGRSIIHDPRKAFRRARRLLAHGTVELWPDASHAISGEFPERVNARVLTFIDGVDGAKSPT